MAFERYFDDGAIGQLKSSDLFKNHLLKDCQKGDVFPAIRPGRIDFYHKGGKLFSFEKREFTTHYKYASVMQGNGKIKDYISEEQLKKLRPIQDFCEGYERIKKNCAMYSGDEAKGVSELYHKFSCVATTDNVVILDIEIAFSESSKNTYDTVVAKNDRIDFLCLDTKTGKLRFFEAKHYKNKEIRSSIGKPALLNQLDGYDKKLSKQKDEILESYKNHIEAMNKIFGTKIPFPCDIDTETKAVIFGFDKQQRDGYLKTEVLNEKNDLYGRAYAVGDISDKKIEIANLFEGLCYLRKKSW